MLDETQVDGSITTSPAAEPVTSPTPPQGNGETAPTSSGDASQAAPVDTGNQSQTDERSLTSQTGPQNAEGKTQAQIDWEKKYHESQKGVGKLTSELGSLRRYREETQRQYEGIDPNAVKAWKQQQEAAKMAALPKWHVKNPERAQFQQHLGEYRRLAGLYQRAQTPEAKAEIAAEMEQFPADTRQAFQDYSKHRAGVHDRLAEELTGYNSIEEMFEAKFQEKFAEVQAKQQAETQVNQWFDAAEHQPIVEYTRDAMAEALRDGVPLAYVQRMAHMQYELDVSRSRLTGTDQVAAAAQARTQAAKANAAITRDTAVGARKADPVAIAKERGIDLASTAYANLLSELNKQNLL